MRNTHRTLGSTVLAVLWVVTMVVPVMPQTATPDHGLVMEAYGLLMEAYGLLMEATASWNTAF